MLNVLRLTSGVLKKLQLSDLAKLLLISSSTSTNSQSIESTRAHILVERSPVIHQHHHIDTNDCSVAAEQDSYHRQHNENTTITSSASPTSAVATFSVIGSTGGINNLNSEWCGTKSQFQEIIEDSIKSYMVQDSNKEEQSREIPVVMSSPNNVSDMRNCDAKSATTIAAAKTSSASQPSPPSSKGCEGSHTTSCSASSSSGKTCFTSSLADILKFLELVGNLKHVKRTGWVLRDVKDCESISGHMYRMSMMTFLLDGTEGLDRTKCMELALVHDLAESLVGDITPFCGISREEKRLREMKAMEDICNLIEPRGKRIYELFLEYEENETPESKFVKDLDRLDMVLQAFEYEKRDDCVLKHQEFFDSTDGKFSHPFVVKLVNEIYSQRQALADMAKKQQQQNQQHQQQEQQNGFASESNGDENVVQKKVSSS